MIIEILAIETSGLDPEKDVILEVALGRLSTTGFSGRVECVAPPAGHQLSEEILAYHKRTGLLEALIKGPRIDLSETKDWLGCCNLRVIWALPFAANFLKKSPLAPALGNAIDGMAVLQLGRAMNKAPSYEAARAGDKVKMLAGVLKELAK